MWYQQLLLNDVNIYFDQHSHQLSFKLFYSFFGYW